MKISAVVCVDASFIVRVLTPGPFSQEAEALLAHWLEAGTLLRAPALFAYEVTATLRYLVYQKAISQARGEAAFATFRRIPVQLSQRQAVLSRAWKLAQEFNQPRAYDTAYLALAQLHQCDFWTADRRLYNAVHARLPWVKWVGDAPGQEQDLSRD